jgi:hypothetical protein
MILRFFSLFFLFCTIPCRASTQEKALETRAVKESWRLFTEKEYEKHPLFFQKFWGVLQTGFMTPSFAGTRSSYLLYDAKMDPCFVIKPIDEALYCVNNCLQGSIKNKQMRKHIPPCLEALTEACCYEIATLCDLAITPPTFLAIFSHPEFFLFSESLFSEHDKEKLCSVQEYLFDTHSLQIALEEASALGKKEIPFELDSEDFASVQLFLWLIYDTDAHAGNFRISPTKQCVKKQIYRLYKIDNGLSLPEQNEGLVNCLANFPQIHEVLSPGIREKIFCLPIEKIEHCLCRFGMQSRLFAFHERISLIRSFAEQEGTTYYDVHQALLR